MMLYKVKISLILLGGFLSSFLENTPIQNGSVDTLIAKTNSLQDNYGYTAVTSFKNGFIAVSNDGRIDRISTHGKITQTENFPEIQFNCITATDQFVFAAGDNGEALISTNNQPFQKIESGTKKNINSLTYFAEFIIAGTNDGEILIGDKEGFFQMIQLNARGNITSLSSRKDVCYGVTDEGEIIHSEDGLNWEVFNFNEAYAGFYKPCSFSEILVTENNIAVIGVHEDGTPAVLFSNLGNVWTERTLNVTDDDGNDGYLEDVPNDIYYDLVTDEYYLACNSGKILILPNCSHCNTLSTIAEENFKGIACITDTMIIVGENFYLKTVNFR